MTDPRFDLGLGQHVEYSTRNGFDGDDVAGRERNDILYVVQTVVHLPEAVVGTDDQVVHFLQLPLDLGLLLGGKSSILQERTPERPFLSEVVSDVAQRLQVVVRHLSLKPGQGALAHPGQRFAFQIQEGPLLIEVSTLRVGGGGAQALPAGPPGAGRVRVGRRRGAGRSRNPRRAVVVSSGLHGVEGFFGSAAQLAWLRLLRQGGASIPGGTLVVLLHAIDPFGFAWRRRVDEGNVDLNRNFLDDGETYTGTPEHYDLVHRLLNPPSPPSRLHAFRPRAAWAVRRH